MTHPINLFPGKPIGQNRAKSNAWDLRQYVQDHRYHAHHDLQGRTFEHGYELIWSQHAPCTQQLFEHIFLGNEQHGCSLGPKPNWPSAENASAWYLVAVAPLLHFSQVMALLQYVFDSLSLQKVSWRKTNIVRRSIVWDFCELNPLISIDFADVC